MKAPSSAIFDEKAVQYDAWFESERGQTLFESEVLCLQKLTDGLPRPWLEVGVGTGRFADALDIEFGLDPARGALAYARRRSIHILEGVGQRLPFQDETFGAVFTTVTICFADDPEGLLGEAARVTRPTGRVVLGIVPAGSAWGRFYADKARAGHPFYAHATFYSLAELENLARRAGLAFVRCVSTLERGPEDEGLEVERPRDGCREADGFVSVLCRPRS